MPAFREIGKRRKRAARAVREWLRLAWKPILGFAVLPVATSWVADYLREWMVTGVDRLSLKDLYLFVFAVVVLLLAVTLLVYTAPALILRTKHIRRADGVRPRAILVAVVSTTPWHWRDGMLIHREGATADVGPFQPGRLQEALEKMKTLKPNYAWEQLLRGLAPHVSRLRKVVLLVSDQTKGRLSECAQMLRFFLGLEGVEVIGREGQFDKLDQLLDVFEEIIEDADDPGEVMLDITGGKKVSSVAAAMATLRYPEVEFQYVDTEGNKEVISFNVVTLSAAA